MLSSLWLALQFLTVIPVPTPSAQGDAPPQMERTLPWFPFVGALLGAALALLDLAGGALFAPLVCGALVLAAGALLTGMLHLDGFADCCDGLLGTRATERRLAIMRDSQVGAYGAIGVALLLLLLFAALSALPVGWRAFTLLAAPALGRWAMVLAIVRYPYARASGTGSTFHARPRHLAGATLVLAAVLALAGVALHRAPAPIFAFMGITVAVTLAWSTWASRRLGGGLTGDTYGALNELVELAVLLCVPVCVRLAHG